MIRYYVYTHKLLDDVRRIKEFSLDKGKLLMAKLIKQAQVERNASSRVNEAIGH